MLGRYKIEDLYIASVVTSIPIDKVNVGGIEVDEQVECGYITILKKEKNYYKDVINSGVFIEEHNGFRKIEYMEPLINYCKDKRKINKKEADQEVEKHFSNVCQKVLKLKK